MDWEQQQQQQQHQYRSQSVSLPQSQYASSSQYVDYGQQHYDRRQPSAYPLPPLQLNPSTYLQSDAALNLPSSSLPVAPQLRPERSRTQSVALTAIGQRERSYPPPVQGYRDSSRAYPAPEATVPISRYSASSSRGGGWVQHPTAPPVEPQVPHIASVMTPYSQQGYPSRHMAPLHEIDRRPSVIEENPQRPKPHVCDQCGAAFSRAHDLKRHAETHKGDRPHKCPTCTKAFSRKDALQRHQSMAQCGLDTAY